MMLAALERGLCDRLKGYEMPSEWLSTYRIGFALYGLFIWGVQNYSWLDDIPEILFAPPLSLASLFDGFPSYPWLVLLSLAIVSCFVLLLFGIRTVWVSLTITALLLIGNSFKYSIGKIDHDILFVLCPAIMAYSGWGNHYSIDQRNGRNASGDFPSVLLLGVLLTFLLFTSAFTKIWTGWLNPEIWAVKGHLLRSVHVLGRDTFIAMKLLSIDDGFFWKSADYLTVALEGLLPITFLFPRWFRMNVVGLLFFHLLVALVLGISFLAYFPVYVLYFDWQKIQDIKTSRVVVKWLRYIPRVGLWWVMLIGLLQWLLGELWLNQPEIMRPTYLRLLFAQLNITIDTEILLAVLFYGSTFIGLCTIYFLRLLKAKSLIQDIADDVY